MRARPAKEFAQTMDQSEKLGREHQSRIATILIVSRSTVCRDMARLMRRYWGGMKAEERHREKVRRDQRIRDEDRWLRGLIEASVAIAACSEYIAVVSF